MTGFLLRARRVAAGWWPTAAAVFLLAFAPHTSSTALTVMQAVSAVFLAYALRQLERHLALRAAIILGMRDRVLHRSGAHVRPAVRPGVEGKELS